MEPDDRGKAISFPRTGLRSRKRVRSDIDRLLADLRARAGTGLHLGAGGSRIEGLINCDLFDPAADQKADAANLADFEDGSVDLIEAHHLIEHLSLEGAERAVAEWRRVLRPGGLLVTTCPDLTRICIKWLRYTILYPIRPHPGKLDYVVRMIVGSQEHEGMFHKSAYDPRRLTRLLATHGFQVEFSYGPYPRRSTPSFLTIARKRG